MKPKFAAHTPPRDSDTWHGLKQHLQKVATRAKQFAEKLDAGELGYYAGLWHDLGKYNFNFQKYLEQCKAASQSEDAEPRDRVPHAIYGAKLAAERFEPLAPLIFGHHAGLQSYGKLGDRLKEVDATTYQSVLQNAALDALDLNISSSAAQQLMGLFQDKSGYELLLRLLFSCLVDADYLDTETHFDPEMAAQRGSRTTVKKLWESLQVAQDQLLAQAADTPVNQVRSQVYQACTEAASLPPGVFRLAVPTGGGKTRSGLAFALAHAVQYGLDRVIVAVPYTSIIEQTVEVYRSIFGLDAVLEHHSAVKPDEGNEEDARSRQAQARLATQNWDVPLIVTTTVQLFESLFANRTSRCRKLHNIVKSVIILDEVQTLPAKLLKPILSVLKELCRQYQVSVVLCTATQPALEGETPYLEGFTAGTVRDIIPKATAIQHFTALNRVSYTVPIEAWSWLDVAQSIQQQDQALVILNTRKDALAILDALPNANEDYIFHLSTLLCGQHRRQVLQQVRDRLTTHEPCILVSTQVVEAGVDLDFPIVYRAIGPLDRIVQAAGRCNREGRRPQKGQVIIFNPQEGKMPPGEYRKAFEETAILLSRENLDWDDPSIFETYFRRVYLGLDTDANKVQNYREVFDFPEVAARFKLIPDDTTPVVIEYNDRASEIIHRIQRYGLRSGDLKALQPYLINLRNREFQETEELREAIAPGLWLWQGNYDSQKGIAIGDMAIVRDPADLIF
ncbi:CRISPR-associated helicase Cas3' [Leptolyngbya sp. FACHB-541]|uniref:CRISPR-associated helicase Cas3' n=1 Tax=Leptolyngbya sp. FACHB-541 TaxID=2692810 RepID=UPI001683839C|nr:CRISPR-associated helicase Cas3' [Leptolyngbya sp. FACHB-541]MBD1998460.1 CRISPR-associated helicase Cas3' [Leptolyngbya sp. FACHB-541]